MTMRIAVSLILLLLAVDNTPCLAQGRKEHTLDSVVQDLREGMDRLRPARTYSVPNHRIADEAVRLATAMNADAAPHLATIFQGQLPKRLQPSTSGEDGLAYFTLASLVAQGKLTHEYFQTLSPNPESALSAMAFVGSPETVRQYVERAGSSSPRLAGSEMVVSLAVATGDAGTVAQLRAWANRADISAAARDRLLLGADQLEKRLGLPPAQSTRQSEFLLEFWRVHNHGLGYRNYLVGIGVAVHSFHQQQGRVDENALVELVTNPDQLRVIWGLWAPYTAIALLTECFPERAKEVLEKLAPNADPTLRKFAEDCLNRLRNVPSPPGIPPSFPMGPMGPMGPAATSDKAAVSARPAK